MLVPGSLGHLFLLVFLEESDSCSLLMRAVVPYACFFLVLALWSMRSSPKVMRHTAYRAPVIFLAFEAAYLVVEFIAGDSLAKDLLGLGGLLVIVSIYVVLLGYLYTLLMEQGYFSYLYQKRHQAHLKNKLQS